MLNSRNSLPDNKPPSRIHSMWLLFTQVVTIILSVVFVAALMDFRIFGIFGQDYQRSQVVQITDGPADFSLAMRRVLPSVVSIRSADFSVNDDGKRSADFSLGSGVVVSADGYIITNAHVIRDATTILVETSDKQLYSAKLVGKDVDLDIAVLKIESTVDLAVASFASGRSVNVGDVVVSVGSPYGLSGTVTMGIISAIGRTDLGLTHYEHFIQTDAAINQGSSGGALANVAGELVGISTALFAKKLPDGGGYSQGIGFAIPANLAQIAYEQIIENGYFRRGWIGIDFEAVDDKGWLLVNQVENRSPASLAGVQDGDYITFFNGRSASQIGELDEAMGLLMQPGDQIVLNLDRQGTKLSVEMVALERRRTK